MDQWGWQSAILAEAQGVFIVLDSSAQKEQFSKAYFRAVAAVAGFAVAEPDPDEDSIDFTLSEKGDGGILRRPKLDVQVKSTAREIVSDGELRFPLKIKNYHELRPPMEDLMVPRILVVVIIPSDIGEWLEHSEEQLALRHCGYWVCLMGQPEKSNTDNVTVSISRTQQFTAEVLREIMDRVGKGQLP